jgi:hypothetical protein
MRDEPAAIFDSVRTAAAREDESSGLTQRLQTIMEKLKQWWVKQRNKEQNKDTKDNKI